MVMRRNAMRKNLRQSILKSMGRYLAIVMIIALGASLFVGLLMTKADMVETGQRFMDQQNMFDIRVMNSYGWTASDVEALSQLTGIADIEGLAYTDVIAHKGDSEEDSVYRFYALTDIIDLASLRGGRMPESADECVIVGYEQDDSILGTTLTLSQTNDEDTLETMTCQTYTIVGYVATPLYMDMNRGTTSVGSGSISNILFAPQEAFNLDYYAEIHITLPGDYAIYSDAYNDAMEDAAEEIEPLAQTLADARLVDVKEQAQESYREGLKEYAEGVWEYDQGKQEARQELESAYQQLLDAKQEIADSEAQLASGQEQLDAAISQLYAAEAELNEGKEQLETIKSALTLPLDTAEALLESSYQDALAQQETLAAEIQAIDGQIAALNASMAEDGAELDALNSSISQLDAEIAGLDAAIQLAQATRNALSLMPELYADQIAQLDASIAAMESQRSAYAAQRESEAARAEALNALLAEPLAQREELEQQKSDLQTQKDSVDQTVSGLESSLATLESSRQKIEAQFASSEAEIAEGEQQIAEGWAEIYASQQQIADGQAALEEGKAELSQGFADYETGRAEVLQELADAKLELQDAKQTLIDAKETIADMTSNSVIILDRNSNIGYNSLDSASDIVQGVSRVFPVFFLLVASLVCITTMTRMIEEERTQIGTLKALGYTNGAIISKYLFYAGSGAILGCGLGVLVGSAVFPVILWQAYKIMLYLTEDIALVFHWPLCAAVVGIYTAVMLLVTWYCCRRTLREVPAELIRPKAPNPGKKIFLEYLPFWPKISFLNKVTLRNIFRYRQRLMMMLVGIGGCTALLVTGFGLRDSIVNVADYQFDTVTTYDIAVYFTDGQSDEEQAKFLSDVTKAGAESAMFYHQSSIDLEVDKSVKEIYLISVGEGVEEFIDFHSGDDPLSLPGLNEVLLSSGVADALGVSTGDTVTMRNADLQTLELTVAGIYDNHVYNYAIVLPETIEYQWGEAPEMQMAFVIAGEEQDIHALGAEISGMHDVMNVSVNQDLADMVGGMMDAMDLVVWVIVFCAGLLAVTVLYNLTNININERMREIATIKVLGFNSGETAAYVFKENLSLTAAGAVLGLGLGYLLLLFVMSQIKIDMVWFKTLVEPVSYFLSIGLTLLAACVVDFVFYFRLEKINMAEALKSVE